MNKKLLGPELSKVINRTAQSLVAASFNYVRAELEAEAKAMLAKGKTRQEIAQVMVTRDVLGGFQPVESDRDLA